MYTCMSFDMLWIGGPIVFAKQRTTVWIFHNLVIIILMDPRSDSTLNYLVSHPSFLFYHWFIFQFPTFSSTRNLFNASDTEQYKGSDCLLFRKKIRKGTPPIVSTPVSSFALLLLNAPCFLYMHRKSSYIYMLFTISNTPEFSIW